MRRSCETPLQLKRRVLEALWRFQKYDTPAGSVEPLVLHEPASQLLSLDLPNAPDFVSRPSRLSLERMVALLEQYRRWFPPTEAMMAQRTKRKCNVEFLL